jgi:ComB9 competence protein
MKRVLISLGLAALLVAAGAHAQTPARKPPPPPPPSAGDVINSVEGNPDVEAQMKGKYPAMHREEVLPLGQIQHAWDKADPKAGVYHANFSPDSVMRVRVREFIATTIVFPAWEGFTAEPLLGDSFAFEASWVAPNKLGLRAKLIGSDTTLTVFGDSGNVYAFYVRAEGIKSENVSDVVVYVHAQMPLAVLAKAMRENAAPADDAKARLTEAVASSVKSKAERDREATGEKNPDFVKGIAFDPNKMQFDFSMSGDKSISPSRVFTDGVFTWFDFGDRWDRSDLPAVYRVIDGVDTPVNTRIKGNMLIAEASGAFTLRNGQRTVCVRPEGFEPDGSYAAPAPRPPASSVKAKTADGLTVARHDGQ